MRKDLSLETPKAKNVGQTPSNSDEDGDSDDDEDEDDSDNNEDEDEEMVSDPDSVLKKGVTEIVTAPPTTDDDEQGKYHYKRKSRYTYASYTFQMCQRTTKGRRSVNVPQQLPS